MPRTKSLCKKASTRATVEDGEGRPNLADRYGSSFPIFTMEEGLVTMDTLFRAEIVDAKCKLTEVTSRRCFSNAKRIERECAKRSNKYVEPIDEQFKGHDSEEDEEVQQWQKVLTKLDSIDEHNKRVSLQINDMDTRLKTVQKEQSKLKYKLSEYFSQAGYTIPSPPSSPPPQ